MLAVSLGYLCYVFDLSGERAWSSGLGDWMDPYFINALLEHWHRSIGRFTDPASPPMFHPVQGTLGYSHGLILYAPFYVPLRQILHPFIAYNLTVLLVMATGTICLYLINRRSLGLSFVESLVLSVFFLTSPNVTHGPVSVWSQRASVFLIPPILFLGTTAARMTDGVLRWTVAAASGLLAALLYTQDFYTAHLALLIVALFAPAAFFAERSFRRRIARAWQAESTAAMLALAVAVLAAAWTWRLAVGGGGELQISGIRIRSNNWERPALLTIAVLAVFVWLRGARRTLSELKRLPGWVAAFGGGAVAGFLVFLWVYFDAYRQHGGFPERDLLNQLIPSNPARWRGPLDLIRALDVYDSFRTFLLAAAAGCAAWLPRIGLDGKARIYWTCFLLISAAVLLIPHLAGGFSVWVAIFAKLPGYGVIRDPKRIIYLYELAAVLAVAVAFTRVPPRAAYRRIVALLALLLIVARPNNAKFETHRPIEVYRRWVAAPIAVDPACASFFIKGASAEYMARPGVKQMVYNIDAVFIALNLSIPTLNGYSAWAPPQWALHNPHHEEYQASVDRWISTHRLDNVCELDIDARTMKPHVPGQRAAPGLPGPGR